MRYAGSQIRSSETYELYSAKPFSMLVCQQFHWAENYPAKYFSRLHSQHLNAQPRRSLPLSTWHGLHNAWRVAVW
jgi:hypothetical protein